MVSIASVYKYHLRRDIEMIIQNPVIVLNNTCRVVKYGEEYTFDSTFPLLYVTGTYDIAGQILLLPLKGTGTFTGNFSKFRNYAQLIYAYAVNPPLLSTANVIGSARSVNTKKTKNGVEYFSISKLDIKAKVGKGSVKLNNLFNGEQVLGMLFGAPNYLF